MLKLDTAPEVKLKFERIITRVAEEVVRMLAGSARFPLDRPEESVSDGVVTLRGRVGSYFQKQVAQSAALTVIGARQLVNEI